MEKISCTDRVKEWSITWSEWGNKCPAYSNKEGRL